MAMGPRDKFRDLEASVDSSYGLIFRMNRLWDKVDYNFLAGNLERANFVLDRIFCNLLYRQELKIVIDGEDVKIKVTDKEKKVKELFDSRLKSIKQKELDCRRRGLLRNAAKLRAQYYQVLTLKDVWLRKFHYKLGLYMRETERSPATSMLGKNPGGRI